MKIFKKLTDYLTTQKYDNFFSLSIVNNKSTIYHILGKELKNDIELVELSVEQNSNSIVYASPRIKKAKL